MADAARPRAGLEGLDWNTLDRLHDKGLIFDPANKAKSVVLTDGLQRAEKLFRAMFTKAGSSPSST